MKFVTILLIIISVAAFLTNIVDGAVKAYQKRLELEMKAEMMEKYKKAYLDYKKAYDDLRRTQSNHTVIKMPEGTLDAVRYAMIHNHPDNGGDPDKFRIYRECYEKLTGKG